MKFKDLKEKDIAKVKAIYSNKALKYGDRIKVLGQMFDLQEKQVRNWLKKLGIKEKEDVLSEDFLKAKKRKFNKKSKRFLITWAQSNTPVHEPFFRGMEAYAKEIGAEIHVIAGRYKNPTSLFSNNQKGESWSPIVTPYLDAARHNVHKYFSIMSDIKVQPTAVNPMRSLQSISSENSCVFGSPKVQMQMVPVLNGQKPKMMLTTGACTLRDYTQSKAGAMGDFHHTLGFVIVEVKDDETFFVRQVTAEENGDFKDLFYDVKFKGEEEGFELKSEQEKQDWHSVNCGSDPIKFIGTHKVSRIKKIEACILGDLHSGHHDQRVIDATHKMLGAIKPKHVVLHDVFDGYSISHHDMKDPIAQYGKEFHGNNDLNKELNEMYDLLGTFEKYKNVVIVRSNHDDFIDRWVKLQDWKKQPTPKNNRLYSQFMDMMMGEAETTTEPKGVIPLLINEKFPDFITLKRDEAYPICNVECGQHGDIASNGSRGSLVSFRNLNTKMVVGHYHAPGRLDGALAVGTSTHLRVGYNKGASSWFNSHVLVHKNGKMQHINFIPNGDEMEFTTFKF